ETSAAVRYNGGREPIKYAGEHIAANRLGAGRYHNGCPDTLPEPGRCAACKRGFPGTGEPGHERPGTGLVSAGREQRIGLAAARCSPRISPTTKPRSPSVPA